MKIDTNLRLLCFLRAQKISYKNKVSNKKRLTIKLRLLCFLRAQKYLKEVQEVAKKDSL